MLGITYPWQLEGQEQNGQNATKLLLLEGTLLRLCGYLLPRRGNAARVFSASF